jgi:hypothetical protein
MQPVIRPFAVHAKILDRRLDLDDPDVALSGQRHEVGATAGCKRQLGQHMRAHFHEQALDAAPHQHGAFRLATVGERVSKNRRNDWHEPLSPILFTV